MADLNYVSPLTSDLTDYYTKTEVDELQQGDAATYATTTQVDSKDNAVKNWVENKGYLTQHQSLANYATKEYVDEAIEDIDGGGMKIRVVNVLPAEGEEGIFYLVYESNDEEENRYAEYIWSDTLNGYEMLGYGTGESVMPDLTDYATKSYVADEIAGIDSKFIYYDNQASGLDDTNVKNAIDSTYGAVETLAASLATVATSGDYDDLLNKPTIPSLTGYATTTYVDDAVGAVVVPDISGLATEQYVDDAVAAIDIPDVSDFITAQDLPDVSIYAETANLATVATSGDYDDLTNKPSIPDTTGMATQTWVQNQGYLTSHQDISGKANSADLATVATSGSYEDLSNKPTIPSTSGLASETYVDNAIAAIKGSEIDNDMNWVDEGMAKGFAYDEIQNNVSAAGLSGDYDDLINKPTIPTVPTNVSSFTNDAGYLTSHQDISGKVDGTVISGTTTAKIFNEADGGGAQIITASARGFAGVHDGSNPDATYATMYVKNAAGTSTLARVDLDGDGKAYYLKNGASKAAGSEIAVKGDIPDVSSFITSADLPDLTGYVESSDLATVATSGDYDDLTNKPTIPSLSGYATETWVGNQGYAVAANLATVATSGDYDDLTNKPVIPSGGASRVFAPMLNTYAFDTNGLSAIPTSVYYNSTIANHMDEAKTEFIEKVKNGEWIRFIAAASSGQFTLANTDLGLASNISFTTYRYNTNTKTFASTTATNAYIYTDKAYGYVGERVLIEYPVDIYEFAGAIKLLPYYNNTSGLTATTIQEAIDELAASAGSSVGYTYDSTTKTVSLSGVSDDNL